MLESDYSMALSRPRHPIRLTHPPVDEAPAVVDLSFCSALLWHTSYSAENRCNSVSSHLDPAPSTTAFANSAAVAIMMHATFIFGCNV